MTAKDNKHHDEQIAGIYRALARCDFMPAMSTTFGNREILGRCNANIVQPVADNGGVAIVCPHLRLQGPVVGKINAVMLGGNPQSGSAVGVWRLSQFTLAARVPHPE